MAVGTRSPLSNFVCVSLQAYWTNSYIIWSTGCLVAGQSRVFTYLSFSNCVCVCVLAQFWPEKICPGSALHGCLVCFNWRLRKKEYKRSWIHIYLYLYILDEYYSYIFIYMCSIDLHSIDIFQIVCVCVCITLHVFSKCCKKVQTISTVKFIEKGDWGLVMVVLVVDVAHCCTHFDFKSPKNKNFHCSSSELNEVTRGYRWSMNSQGSSDHKSNSRLPVSILWPILWSLFVFGKHRQNRVSMWINVNQLCVCVCVQNEEMLRKVIDFFHMKCLEWN